MYKRSLPSALAFLLFVFTLGLNAQQKFVANLSGLQEVPDSGSLASGLCKISLNPAETGLTVNCDYAGLESSGTVSIHTNTPVGQNGPAAFSIPRSGQSGAFAFNVGISPPDVVNLRANRWYINLTSNAFPGGEIRGQIKLANGTYNDYDADGRTDIQVYRSSNNTFYAGRSTDGNLIVQQLGQPGDSVSLTVDFDGDGKSDFSTARYSVEVLWRIFQSTTNSLQETSWGSSASGDFFAAADYDGDGKFDIAVYRAGVWYIIESSTGTYRYDNWGRSGDIPAANDFDKDGKADLTVARSESGQRVWYTRLSSDGQNRVVTWGLSSDAFFTGRADFDGDGAADICVIRNEAGQRVFYILRSSDSQLQVIQWGRSSDVVKLGDYDGDGKTDPAITRAADGQRIFYILQSTTGQPRYETFGLAGDF